VGCYEFSRSTIDIGAASTRSKPQTLVFPEVVDRCGRRVNPDFQAHRMSRRHRRLRRADRGYRGSRSCAVVDRLKPENLTAASAEQEANALRIELRRLGGDFPSPKERAASRLFARLTTAESSPKA